MLPAEDKAALKVLFRELGLVQGIATAIALVRAEKRGEPFAELEPAKDERERQSRAQIGPAIVLYRRLKAKRGADEAMRIVREVVNASGVVFMRKNIGTLSSRQLEALDEAGRKRFVEERGERFFNARRIDWERFEPRAVSFTIHACSFPGLCAAVGVSELAPLFCGVDAAFFGSVEPNVELERPRTLAGGQDACEFHLRWVEKG